MDEKKLDLTQDTPDCQELDDDALEGTSGGAGSKPTCPRCHQRAMKNGKCSKCGYIHIVIL